MKKILIGNEAIARGAYEAGVKVCSSYPGTPSTEITETIASAYPSIYSEWATNEKVGVEVAAGASIAGARSMSCMKHVGLNVAADPIFTLSYTGVNGGLVIVVADDPGMHSSQNEQDSRNYALAAKIPMLEPADCQECKDYMIAAFEMSEQYDTPVAVRLTTRVAHSRSPVELGEPLPVRIKPYKKNTDKFVMMPGMAIRRHPVVEARMQALAAVPAGESMTITELRSADIGIVTSGISYQYVREALPEASVLKLGMVWPLNAAVISDFAAKVGRLVVVEELDPFLETFIRSQGIRCEGKNLFTLLGEYNVPMIRRALTDRKDPACAIDTAELESAPGRPPVMCAGCSHKGVFMALGRLGATVAGDIGCYTLGALPPYNAMDACICMGASVGMAHGFDKATDHAMSANTVAVIGDSTFLHSGITGLINSVYNRSHSTLIILDNSITGMTGHQQNPGTGFGITGDEASSVNIPALCEAIGVASIRIVDPADMFITMKIIKEEMERKCVSVIIAQRPCALIPKGRGAADSKAVVNPATCTRCKACLKSMCPAMSEGRGGDIVIDRDQCNGCTLCEKLCRFGSITMGK
ncbi:MAG: indolepyruvate ferredoxin oxidoreductase subunit alpha [Saccharofermentanales bacterium]